MVKEKRRSVAREICYTAMFTAIIAVCAWISVPLPGGIPVTLQTMGVCLAAGFLGWKRGLLAVTVYILLGLCGVPRICGIHGGRGEARFSHGRIYRRIFVHRHSGGCGIRLRPPEERLGARGNFSGFDGGGDRALLCVRNGLVHVRV